MTSRRCTSCRSLLGTSMPTVFLPGSGATMRTLGTRRAMARSSARPVMRLSRRPASSSTSNWAMTGPVWIFHHADVETEVVKGLFQHLGLLADLLFLLFDVELLALDQQLQRRQFVVGCALADVRFVEFVEHSSARFALRPADAHARAERLAAVGRARLVVFAVGLPRLRLRPSCASPRSRLALSPIAARRDMRTAN